MNWLFQLQLRLPSCAGAPGQRLRPDARVFHLIAHTASFRTRNEGKHIAAQHRRNAPIRQTTAPTPLPCRALCRDLSRFVAPAEGIMRARVAIEVGSSSLNAAGGGSRATLARQRPDVCAAKMMASWRVALASSHRRRDDLRMDFRPSIRPSDRPRSDRRIGLRLDACWTARPSPAAMLRDTWLAMLAKDEVRNS